MRVESEEPREFAGGAWPSCVAPFLPLHPAPLRRAARRLNDHTSPMAATARLLPACSTSGRSALLAVPRPNGSYSPPLVSLLRRERRRGKGPCFARNGAAPLTVMSDGASRNFNTRKRRAGVTEDSPAARVDNSTRFRDPEYLRIRDERRMRIREEVIDALTREVRFFCRPIPSLLF